MATRRRAAKRNGSRRILNLSALDLENLAQAELYRYFEPVPGLWNPDDPMTPQPRTHGGRLGLAPAARAYIYPEARA
ncbi:MAG TPA: hypothetical protein VFB95_07335, partial [Candidatus Cryosericum sp.]|nr:hypothetical protein [Candidatus Cryosericum sp.]